LTAVTKVLQASTHAKDYRLHLLALLFLTTLARLALAGMLDLGQDEAYALAVSRPFQWSLFDHPPMAFWTAGLMQAVFGGELSPFLLRLPFVLMFTGSTWAMFALTRRYFGANAGLWAAGLLNCAPFFFASAGSWVVPDGPLTLFLLLAALYLARALEEEAVGGRWRDWLFAGAFAGLALLSKYQAALTLLGALAFMLATVRGRAWLTRPQPYVAAALAVLIFLPVILWNATNGWVSFRFQLGRGGGAASVDSSRIFALLAGEAAYLLPWLLIALLAAAIARRRAPGAGYLIALALPPILLFNLLPLIGPAGLPHWSMAGWLFLFPLLGHQLATASERRRWWPAAFGGISALAMAAFAMAAVLLISPYRVFPGDTGLNRFLVEATDWSGVRAGLETAGLLNRPNTFLAATSWLDGAHIAEALRPSAPVIVFGDDPRGFAFIDNPNRHLGEDAVFVANPDALENIRQFAAAHFNRVDTIGTFTTSKGGFPAFSQTVLLAHHFTTPVTTPYGLK
jgi:4-amino-4-deoxy-L-arabinose transferase-like glycosyltransferase